MGLVEDDGVVGAQERIALDLRQQDAVGHELHVRRRRGLVREADLVADLAPELDLELLGHARSDAGRGDAPRLGHADARLEPAPHREADLGQLRRLPRAGLTGDDDDLMGVDRGGDVADASGDRELFGEVNGHGGEAVAREGQVGVASRRRPRWSRSAPLAQALRLACKMRLAISLGCVTSER